MYCIESPGNLITNSMVQSLSSEAVTRLVKKFPTSYGNRRFISVSTGPYPEPDDPVHIFPPSFPRIYFNIIFPSTPRSYVNLFRVRKHTQVEVPETLMGN
jgi:hypothetical protein